MPAKHFSLSPGKKIGTGSLLVICGQKLADASWLVKENIIHNLKNYLGVHCIKPKNTKNAFLACFSAYVGQPDDHIGWANFKTEYIKTNLVSSPLNFKETWPGGEPTDFSN